MKHRKAKQSSDQSNPKLVDKQDRQALAACFADQGHISTLSGGSTEITEDPAVRY